MKATEITNCSDTETLNAAIAKYKYFAQVNKNLKQFALLVCF